MLSAKTALEKWYGHGNTNHSIVFEMNILNKGVANPHFPNLAVLAINNYFLSRGKVTQNYSNREQKESNFCAVWQKNCFFKKGVLVLLLLVVRRS